MAESSLSSAAELKPKILSNTLASPRPCPPGRCRPGCLLKCRIIGIIEGEQGSKKQLERNDRVVAVEQDNHSYAHMKHIDDLGKTFVRELEEFFVDYHKLSGEQYRVLDVRGPGEARRRIKNGIKAFKKKWGK
jgi:inorganic pyrophosphatase